MHGKFVIFKYFVEVTFAIAATIPEQRINMAQNYLCLFVVVVNPIYK